jgi:hypothetical protein
MLSFLCFQSCELDQSITTDDSITSSNQSNALSIHFENFESEAAKRNFPINLSSLDLSAEISSIHEEHIAGTCSYSAHQGNHIIIDKEFWDQSSFTLREMVVFHELGHCVLAQGHREDTDKQGNCLSIMQSGTQDCRLLYNQTNREYYLDELFYY